MRALKVLAKFSKTIDPPKSQKLDCINRDLLFFKELNPPTTTDIFHKSKPPQPESQHHNQSRNTTTRVETPKP